MKLQVWIIELLKSARGRLGALGFAERTRSRRFIDERLRAASVPDKRGKSSTGTRNGFRRFRVGDYRLIARLESARLVIFIPEVADRGEVCK